MQRRIGRLRGDDGKRPVALLATDGEFHVGVQGHPGNGHNGIASGNRRCRGRAARHNRCHGDWRFEAERTARGSAGSCGILAKGVDRQAGDRGEDVAQRCVRCHQSKGDDCHPQVEAAPGFIAGWR